MTDEEPVPERAEYQVRRMTGVLLSGELATLDGADEDDATNSAPAHATAGKVTAVE